MSQLRMFYVGLAAVAAKIPHLVLVAALAITIWGPTVLAALTGTPLAADAIYVSKAIAFATAILALAKQLPPGSPTGAVIDAAALGAGRLPGSRGFARTPAIALLIACAFLAIGTVRFLTQPAPRAPVTSVVESPVEELGGCSGVGPVSPNTVQQVLNDEQYACVVDQIINTILPSGAVQDVAAAIQTACADQIPSSATQLIVNFINALTARSGDAGLARFLLSHGAVRR